MFLSVSVPVFNAEKYLDRCINSIIQQDFDDYELILVDDGSGDKSYDICLAWQEQYPEKIKVIRKENSGSLLTRRECLMHSKGQYVYVLDADDYLLDVTFFSQIKKYFEEYKCDLLLFNATSGAGHDRYYDFPFKNLEVFENEDLKRIYREAIKGDNLNSLWSKIFSRDLVDWDIDYSPYKSVTNGTDMFQMIPIVFAAKRILYWDKVAYYYQLTENENSIVHKFKPTTYESLKQGYNRLQQYAKNVLSNDAEMMALFKTRALFIVSTSIYKVTLLPKDKINVAKEYVKSIGEDSFFQLNYDRNAFKSLPISRKVIILLLHWKFYGLLVKLIGISSFLR